MSDVEALEIAVDALWRARRELSRLDRWLTGSPEGNAYAIVMAAATRLQANGVVGDRGQIMVRRTV